METESKGKLGSGTLGFLTKHDQAGKESVTPKWIQRT